MYIYHWCLIHTNLFRFAPIYTIKNSSKKTIKKSQEGKVFNITHTCCKTVNI